MSRNKDYRSLPKQEKFKILNENLICGAEKKAYSDYMTALENDDFETVNYFESFGDRPYQFISNYRNFNQNCLFGFDEKIYDEYGWIKRPVFEEKEDVLIYVHKNGWKDENKIQIGRGKNGKWTDGIYAHTDNGGQVNGISAWGEIFQTKELAIINACKRMIKYHQDNTWSGSNKIIDTANEMIQTMLGNRPIQLTLSLF